MGVSNKDERWQAKYLSSERGVTFLELVVYLVISGMLLATAVTAFLGQNSSYNRQDVIAEIQQNIRGATEQMASDIRFAGVGLVDSDEIAFTFAQMDYFGINLDSDLGEDWGNTFNNRMKTVAYRLNDNNDLERGYKLLTSAAPISNWQIIAENIEKLRFEYLVEETSTTWNWYSTPPNLDNIRAVKIVMLGSARESAFNPTDTTIYTYEPPPLPVVLPVETWTPEVGSGYKRMMSTVVQCRNNRG